jgi:uncharacterized protein (TIGR03067 family)
MFARCVGVACVMAGAWCTGDDKIAGKDELAGEWVAVSIQQPSGIKLDEEGLKKSKLVVKNGEWIPTTNGREYKMTYKLDASKTPTQIDFAATREGRDFSWPALYKLEGDTLTVSRPARSGGERPKDLTAGFGVIVAVYKRAPKQ